MARDRKRAKQRQRQRQQQAARRPARTTGEREGQDPEAAPDAAPDEIVKPDPLAESSAEVEIAEAAMVDAPTGDLGPEEQPAADELGEDQPLGDEEEPDDSDAINRSARGAFGRSGEEGTGPSPQRRAAAPGAELPKEGNRVTSFLRASVAELRRVQWPDRRQVTQATGVVLGFVIIAGGYLGLLDAVFSRLVNAIL